MKRFLLLLLILGSAFGAFTQAQQPSNASASSGAQSGDENAAKARKLIDQMIDALGGQKYLSVRTFEQEGRTSGFYHGKPNGSTTPFWRFVELPDKERIELLKTREWVLIYTGDEGYESTYHGTRPAAADVLRDYLQRRNYSLETVLHTWVKDPGTAFFYEGTAFTNNKQVDQVTLLNAKNEGVTFAIDQETHLPVSKSFTTRDPQTREKDEDTEIYENWKNIDGIMTPHVVTRMKNGEISSQRFIARAAYNTPLNESLFVPKDTPKPRK